MPSVFEAIWHITPHSITDPLSFQAASVTSVVSVTVHPQPKKQLAVTWRLEGGKSSLDLSRYLMVAVNSLVELCSIKQYSHLPCQEITFEIILLCHYTPLLCFICLLLIAGAEYYHLKSLLIQNFSILAHIYVFSFFFFYRSLSFCFLKYGLF